MVGEFVRPSRHVAGGLNALALFASAGHFIGDTLGDGLTGTLVGTSSMLKLSNQPLHDRIYHQGFYLGWANLNLGVL
jgi:hypothetical protein